ncbi:MAG: endonuclease/exonuclease/phosphatase family protein [Sedimentisphaerales bacterium]
MKIATWNLGYWQYKSFHDEAWNYLCNEIKPDIAFLQEVKPPSWIPHHALLFEKTKQGWGTALFAPSLALQKKDFSLSPGRVAAASIVLDKNLPLFIASIHAPTTPRVFPRLAKIFAELELHLARGSVIVGGDLNTARLAEKVWPGNGHGPFFEQIDKGDRWVDCCRMFHPTEIQTFFRANCIHPFQDDHIFASCDLKNRVKAANIIDNELTRRVSDHIPLVVEIDVEL